MTKLADSLHRADVVVLKSIISRLGFCCNKKAMIGSATWECILQQFFFGKKVLTTYTYPRRRLASPLLNQSRLSLKHTSSPLWYSSVVSVPQEMAASR